MVSKKLKDFLDRKTAQYNTPAFIPEDPISIPHLFTGKQDIEIAGFFAAIFAWGIRKTIINKCRHLLNLMDNAPYDFCLHHSDNELKQLLGFTHRTFNDTDLLYTISFLKKHYATHTSLEDAFIVSTRGGVEHALNHFYHYFFSLPDVPKRTRKHIACPERNSACKRLNMYLRWMVRNDNKGVDFGLWKKLSPSQLICPLDLHVARVAASFKLLKRKITDWKAALELTKELKKLDPEDPVKYDFALFGLGVIERY